MNIEEEILARAENYALGYDEVVLRNNDIRMKSPVLFVILGDKVRDGLDIIEEAMSRNIMNAEGAIYLVIGSREDGENEDAISREAGLVSNPNISNEEDLVSKKQLASTVSYQDTEHQVGRNTYGDKRRGRIELILPKEIEHKKRGELGRLIEEDTFLQNLNESVLRIKQLILEKNKVFTYWEQIHVSVITAASDPTNVLLPDLMVLLKSKLGQDFKQVFTDLFIRLEEADEDSTPMNQALALSLFKELDIYQSPDFIYEKEIEMLEEQMKLKVKSQEPLFNLVYILSDKKENGQKINEASRAHYESVVAVNLLKNREQKTLEIEEAREQYNHNVFISSIREMAQNRYCTARLAKVKKPGVGIYLAVAYHLFTAYKKELSYEGLDESQALLEVVGLSEQRILEQVNQILPSEEELGEIYSLISRNVSFKELKSTSFKEAENYLYGTSAKDFFELNFEKIGEKNLKVALGEEKIHQKLMDEVVSNPSYGPFAIGQLFKSEAFKRLDIQREKYLYKIRSYEGQIEEKENFIVGEYISGGLSLFEKKYLRAIKDYFIKEIYKLKYAILLEKLQLKAIDALKEALEIFNEHLNEKLDKLKHIEGKLLEMMEESSKYEEEYLVQNVKEYYDSIVKEKLEVLCQVKGEHFLHEEKYMGPIHNLLNESERNILEKLFSVEEKVVLSDEKLFGISFEEELLARANMLVEYEDKEVVAKSELYDLLYQSLEENSKPCVHLDTTLSPHRYEEKYFFGDRDSEFISYAYKRDQSSRSYKIGTISDKRKSIIEKLQLMGGFRLQDLLFTRAAERYYAAYKEKGYCFHIEDINVYMERGEIDGK